ncbi:MAG: hypothetical protein WC829_03815 [Hyphomicrobium sp.]
MSRVEHDSFRDSDCLCGRGQVTRHVASTDYPFGGAHVTYQLECPHCAVDWFLEHGWFVDKVTYAGARAANSLWMSAAEKLREVGSRVVDAHMERVKPPTRKAELTELDRLGLSAVNYRQYLDARRQGRTPGQIANLYLENDNLVAIAGPAAEDLSRLARDVKSAKALWEEAAKRVVRRRAPKLS